MKPFRTTSILFGIFVLLLFIAVFFGSDTAQKKRDESVTKAPLLRASQLDQVDRIVFSPVGNESYELYKSPEGHWMIGAYRVSRSEEERLTTTLKEFPKGDMVSRNKGNWVNYGLTDESASRIVLKNGDQELATLFLGSTGPSYQSVYVRSSLQEDVHLVSTQLGDYLRYDIDRWKNREMFLIDEDEITAFTVRIGEEKWQFQRNGESWEWLENGAWKEVDAPEAMDSYMSNMLAFQAENVEADESLFEAADNAVAIMLEDGKEYVVSIDKKEDSLSFAKATDQPGLFRISSDFSTRLRPDFLMPVEEPVSEISPSTEIAPE